MDDEMRRSIILDNYSNAKNRDTTDDNSYIVINSNNVNCIDNINIYLKIDKDRIIDVKFEGEACVIAISSTSILSEMLKGKRISEAKNILDNYFKMIAGEEYDEELMGEANVYSDIYKHPARKTCATLFARGINKELDKR